MKNHKIELILATIMLVIHLIMVAIHEQMETNFTYWIILDILLFGSVVLISRISWEKFKKNILNEGYQPVDKLNTTNPPKK